MKQILFFVIFFFSKPIFSCEISKSGIINFAIAPEQKSYFSYNVEQVLHKKPYIRAVSCADAAMSGKYLMVAFGPEIVELEDTNRGINFNGEYKDPGCKLIDSPFKEVQSFKQRLEEFNHKQNFIKSCLEISVEDEGPQPLQMPAKQVGCNLERLTNHKAVFNGGFCYFKPSFNSSYLIQFNIKDHCLTREGLAQNNINIRDLNAGINFYLSGDASGNSINLRALSNTRMRFTVNPDSTTLPASDDFGIAYPTFPLDWKIPDLHLGNLKITELYQSRAKIEYSFLVDNRCTTGHCEYAQPVVAEISLFQIHSADRKEFLTSWYEGGIAEPHFQGLIQGISFEVPPDFFKIGGVYEIQAHFMDPKFDFEKFKNRVKNKLNTIDQQLGRIERSNIPGIQDIPSIRDSISLPSIAPISNINFERPLDSVEQVTNILRNYLSFKIWPPYYEKMCGEMVCEKIKDNLVNINTKFIVKSIDPETQMYHLEINNVERLSPLVDSYKKENYTQPTIQCGNDGKGNL